ncbi:NAK protein kinase, variant [Aphanomyces astaci]|uniref:non-specific serine/threonine protein kinase n=1 Tax=Aphanomyces astaci TaxID=112090 RepID=W4FQW7_APHAT|nr:NAK protein kinase, variant [Aphanomyces astaci]ETV69890.1 NAK protein kinase, variant [Aphanomyces astaci]|eukprot:XP_009840627.1 NAK protein kinase, variant [Aphanomyces astaci]
MEHQAALPCKAVGVIDTDLAEGGFSFVYVVHDVDTMKQFAMKKIPCQSSEQRQLVSHELGVHNKCRHKHLMPLVDYAVVHTAAPDTSTYFLVFPLVENGSLRQYIDSFRSRQAFMPERAVVDIFVKVSQAVAFLHAQEPCLVHRDIKPENILLDHDLDPILTDFGSVIQGDVAILTRSDALKAQEVAAIHSSMAYRAPELYDVPTSSTLTCGTDVWSMGCLLYAMMFGYSPFECSINDSGHVKLTDCTYLAVLGTVKFPSQCPYDPFVFDLVRWMLTVDTTLRPTMADVLCRLERRP